MMLLMLITLVSSFTLYKNNQYNKISSLSMVSTTSNSENTLKNIIVSGFVSKANQIAESFVFSKLYEKVNTILNNIT